MTELELRRDAKDRRLFTLDGRGSLRFEGFFSRRATAGPQSWLLSRVGFWQRTMEATDATGTVVGRFSARSIRRGGELSWSSRSLELRPASVWRERYAIVENGRELAVLDGKGWGKRPVAVTLLEEDAVEPGLLLFAAFVVHQSAKDASETAAGTSATFTGTYTG